jgi:hypothetical protein
VHKPERTLPGAVDRAFDLERAHAARDLHFNAFHGQSSRVSPVAKPGPECAQPTDEDPAGCPDGAADAEACERLTGLAQTRGRAASASADVSAAPRNLPPTCRGAGPDPDFARDGGNCDKQSFGLRLPQRHDLRVALASLRLLGPLCRRSGRLRREVLAEDGR